jgi:hypothetical protein
VVVGGTSVVEGRIVEVASVLGVVEVTWGDTVVTSSTARPQTATRRARDAVSINLRIRHHLGGPKTVGPSIVATGRAGS